MKSCEKIIDCPFFEKFSEMEKGFKHLYCEGPLLDQCSRIGYKEKHGVKPPDGLAPTGVLFESEA